MAFTRSFLKSVLGDGATDEKVQSIIDAHLEVVNPIKEERDKLKENAGEVEDLRKQVADLTEKGGDAAKIRQEYEDYRKQVETEKAETAVKTAYQKMLRDAKISEKGIEVIMKPGVVDFSKMTLGEDGNLAGLDDLRKAAESEWGVFIESTHTKGASVENPPESNPARKSMADIFKQDEHGKYLLSTEERQKAIAQNLESN